MKKFYSPAVFTIIVSLFITVTGFAQAIGEYRSRQTGNWNAPGPTGTWEQWNGSAWVTSFPQTSAGSVTISSSFPVIAETNTSQKNTTTNAAHVINLPSGIKSGDLLLIFWTDAGTLATEPALPADWTQLYSSSASSSYRKAWYKIATGSEGSTVLTTASIAERSTHVSYRIAAGTYAGTPFFTSSPDAGTDDSPNPPNLAPGIGSQNFLWIAAVHARESQTFTVPALYSANQLTVSNTANTTADYSQMITAWRNNAAASEDPLAFDLGGSAVHAAYTIGIQGIAGGTFPNPLVAAIGSGAQNSDATSHVIDIPTGDAGDLLVVVFSADANENPTVGSGTGWTKLNNENAVNGTAVTGVVFYKMASGTTAGDDALTLTTTSEQSSHITYRIRGATGISGTSANNSSTNSDPPSHTASEASFLWIATRSGDAQVVATAAPSGYSNLLTQTASTANGASTNTAINMLGTASLTQNPGIFTSATEQWVSWTLAIHGPAPVVTNIPISYPETGFPVVGSTNTSTQTSTSSSAQVVSLPENIVAGDLLVVFYADANPTGTATLPSGWTSLYNLVTSSGNHRSICMYRVADGSEESTVTITTTTNQRSAHNSYRIEAGTYHGLPEAVASLANGSSNAPDPPGLSPSGGNKSYLWIAASHSAGDDNSPAPSAPGSYTNLITGYTGDATTHTRMLTARRNNAVATENPGAFTIGATENWGANTVAIRGSGVATVLNGHTVTTVAGVSAPDVTINSGGQLIINNGITHTVPAGGTFNVDGTLQMGTDGSAMIAGDGAFSLNSSGTIGITSSAGIAASGATGNVQVTGTRTFTAGANYICNGSGVQVMGTGFPASVNNFTIDNAAGITLSSAVTVTGTATFTSGIISTSSGSITIDNGAVVSGASDASFVDGPVKKKGIVNASGFEFPVGKAGTGYMPVKIANVSGAATEFTAEYFRASAMAAFGTTGFDDIGLQAVSGCEYWTLNRTAGSSDADVTLSWNGHSPCNSNPYLVDPLAGIYIAHYNTTSLKWDAYGGGTPAGNAAAGYLTWPGVSSFSPFALAALTGSTSTLPVTLSDMKAYERNNGVQIEWSNLTERDLVKYEVERSANGVNFITISQQLPGSNQNNKESYAAFDASPFSGANFYRIKILEISGKVVYSKVLKVDIGGKQQGFNLYPNPVTGGQISISLNAKQGQYSLKVMNSSGQEVYSQKLDHRGGSMTQTIELPSVVKPGVYNMMISGDNYRESKMFVVQ